MCQYCYLNTNLGRTPYVRIYVNVDEILDQAEGYVKARRPQDTVFEGSATSDPVAVEAWTGSLARAIEPLCPTRCGAIQVCHEISGCRWIPRSRSQREDGDKIQHQLSPPDRRIRAGHAFAFTPPHRSCQGGRGPISTGIPHSPQSLFMKAGKPTMMHSWEGLRKALPDGGGAADV